MGHESAFNENGRHLCLAKDMEIGCFYSTVFAAGLGGELILNFGG